MMYKCNRRIVCGKYAVCMHACSVCRLLYSSPVLTIKFSLTFFMTNSLVRVRSEHLLRTSFLTNLNCSNYARKNSTTFPYSLITLQLTHLPV